MLYDRVVQMNDERAVCDALIDDDWVHSDMVEGNVKVVWHGKVCKPASRQAYACGTYLLLLASICILLLFPSIPQLCPC
jgi:hypothetical protein